MNTFCPSTVGCFEDVLGVGRLSVAFDSIFMSHRHVGRAWFPRVLPRPLAEFQIFGLFVIHPTQTFDFKQIVCFQNLFRKHAVECVLAAVWLRAPRCGSADFTCGLYCEELALISGSCCWPTVGWFAEKALGLRMNGVWHLPHQTKIHRQGSLPIFQSADLC